MVVFSDVDGIGVFQVGSKYIKVQQQSSPLLHLQRGGTLHNSIKLAVADSSLTAPALVSITAWDGKYSLSSGGYSFNIVNGIFTDGSSSKHIPAYTRDLGKNFITESILSTDSTKSLYRALNRADNGDLMGYGADVILFEVALANITKPEPLAPYAKKQ